LILLARVEEAIIKIRNLLQSKYDTKGPASGRKMNCWWIEREELGRASKEYRHEREHVSLDVSSKVIKNYYKY